MLPEILIVVSQPSKTQKLSLKSSLFKEKSKNKKILNKYFKRKKH